MSLWEMCLDLSKCRSHTSASLCQQETQLFDMERSHCLHCLIMLQWSPHLDLSNQKTILIKDIVLIRPFFLILFVDYSVSHGPSLWFPIPFITFAPLTQFSEAHNSLRSILKCLLRYLLGKWCKMLYFFSERGTCLYKIKVSPSCTVDFRTGTCIP